MASIGRQRVEKRIQTLVGELLLREIKDPRLGFVTVTRAELSKDMKEARVFVSILGTDAQRRTSLRALEDSTRFLQQRVGKQLKTREIPRIRFVFDESVDKNIRLAEIFRDIERERGDAPVPGEGEPGIEEEGDEDGS